MVRRHVMERLAAARKLGQKAANTARLLDLTTPAQPDTDIDLNRGASPAADTNALADQPFSGKRLILHIGFHKTGTSAIQELLNASRVRLLSNRVVYPQPGCDHPSHIDLATALDFNPRTDEFPNLDADEVLDRYRRLIADAPAGSTIIISSEEFCSANHRPQALENLSQFLRTVDAAVTVLAYTRDSIEFLLSIYHHEIRDVDTTIRFGPWLDQFPLDAANFERRMQPWHDSLGDLAEIVVRDYEAIRNRKGSVINDLVDACGLDELDLAPNERKRNLGVHPRLVEAYIAVRASDLETAEKRRYFYELQTIGALMPRIDGAAFHLGEQGKADLRKRLDERYAKHAAAAASTGSSEPV